MTTQALNVHCGFYDQIESRRDVSCLPTLGAGYLAFTVPVEMGLDYRHTEPDDKKILDIF